jgi:glycosyltransferase involved in cell wall biosynthesis
MPPPSVTVILSVLNEADHIEEVMGDLLGQDYEGPLEVVVADGGSVDGTKEKVLSLTGGERPVKVIDNPEVRQAFGLNRAAEMATGEILVRADGHTRFAPDYVRASVQVLEEVGGAVGGRMAPLGRTPFGRAVAAAMESPLTMGPGRFHHATKREEVDTVYLGAFRKDDFEALGGFRAFPSGSSEDADFYYRWRKSGRRIHVDPWIVSSYTPRDTPAALWRQYFRYGMGKAEMLWVNGELPSWRPLAPLALVLGLILFALAGLLTGGWVALSLLTGLWLLVLVWVALRADAPAVGVFRAAGIMHLAYGIGMIWGLVRGPGSIRQLKPR